MGHGHRAAEEETPDTTGQQGISATEENKDQWREEGQEAGGKPGGSRKQARESSQEAMEAEACRPRGPGRAAA